MKPLDPSGLNESTDNPNLRAAWAMRLGLLTQEQKDYFFAWVVSCTKSVPYSRWPEIIGDHAISQDEILGMIDAFPDLAPKILYDLALNNWFGLLDRHPWFAPYVRSVAEKQYEIGTQVRRLTLLEIIAWAGHILSTAFFPGKDAQGLPLTSGALLVWMTSFRSPRYMAPVFWVFKLKRPIVPLFEIYFANVPEFIEAAKRMK